MLVIVSFFKNFQKLAQKQQNFKVLLLAKLNYFGNIYKMLLKCSSKKKKMMLQFNLRKLFLVTSECWNFIAETWKFRIYVWASKCIWVQRAECAEKCYVANANDKRIHLCVFEIAIFCNCSRQWRIFRKTPNKCKYTLLWSILRY